MQYVVHREALAELMQRKGFNTPRLAAAAGVSASFVNYLLNGQRVIISAAVREGLADALTVCPDDIGTDTDVIGLMFSTLAMRRNPAGNTMPHKGCERAS
jgi:transcriptional regulator with XRE-family HTH domain